VQCFLCTLLCRAALDVYDYTARPA
jgi:hypothetical protein